MQSLAWETVPFRPILVHARVRLPPDIEATRCHLLAEDDPASIVGIETLHQWLFWAMVLFWITDHHSRFAMYHGCACIAGGMASGTHG